MHENSNVRKTAVETLGHFGSGATEILPELEKLKQHHPEHQSLIEQTIEKIKTNDI